MSDLVLYSYWRSSCSYRVRIALEYKELDYEYRGVHLVRDGGEQHKEAFRKLNPLGQVPYLEHGDKGLAQSLAIMAYLDDTFPQKALFPTDSYQRAQVLQLCGMINALQPLQNLNTFQELERRHGLDGPGKAEWARHWIGKAFTAYETELQQSAGTYCFGDQVSAADCFLVPQVYNANRFKLDMAPFPHITRINETLLAQDFVKRAEPSAQPDAVPA